MDKEIAINKIPVELSRPCASCKKVFNQLFPVGTAWGVINESFRQTEPRCPDCIPQPYNDYWE